jgi:phage tail sheath gpL-like
MTDAIALTGLTPNWRKPGVFVQVSNAAGPIAGTSKDRPTVIFGPKLSTGTYTANRLYWPRDASEVEAGAGKISAAARAWKFANRVNKGSRIGIVCYAETSGGSAAAASTTITVGGTTATGTSVWTLGTADIDTSVLISTGDTPATVAGNMRAALAANGIIVASGSTTSVILTYPHAGTRGGTASYKPVKLTTNAPGVGITITLPGDLGATTPGVEGSTAEATNLAAALAANSGVWVYNIVNDLGGDSAALTALASFLGNQALPLAGKRGTAILAHNGAYSAASTLALAKNYERLHEVGAPCFRNAPDEVAAQVAALFAKHEETDRTYPFGGYSGPDFLLTPVADSTQWPDDTTINNAILGGVMPLAVNADGRGYIVDATTTRIKDATGTYTDYRAYKRHRVSGADDAGDKLQRTLTLNMQGKKLASDPVDDKGRPVYNNTVPPKVTYPRTLKKYCAKELENLVNAGQAQELDTMLSTLQVVRSTDNVERVLCSVEYRTIDHASQGGIVVNEVTPG